jgi:predicted ABC-type transport system involved in lysophospholipase L1 biosynthesis ATPase subunit
MYRKTFTWERLNYHVPSGDGQRRLLHDVYGYVKPGTLTALMGASGAGMLSKHYSTSDAHYIVPLHQVKPHA